MTKEAIIYNFWSSFNLPAYEENSVPTGDKAPNFPYITYQVVTDSLGSNVSATGSIWYSSTSWKEINAKTEEISKDIGIGGKRIACDNGLIWIKRGLPFAQSMGDPEDDKIKRKLINLEINYLTEN